MTRFIVILKNNVWETIAGAGALSLFVGLWLIYPPLALVVLGIGAIVFALWGARAWALPESKGGAMWDS